MSRLCSMVVCFVCLVGTPSYGADATDAISFSRDVQPLLASKCFRCHGPDEGTLESGLRLDVRAVAIGELDSGERAIVPGEPARSELLARVASTDEFVRMPPPDAGEALKPAEIELLRRWIADGAAYETHWAWVPPVRTVPPASSPVSPRKPGFSGANPIDAFVRARLVKEGLEPAAEADRWVLARRVALDLTGLPPSPERARAFVRDDRPDAYERYVDELLASPAYGERWARVWLDLARYADSAGYAQDPPRTIWRYRDWVIDALNDNQPYDRFTVEQLAGDLLPDPTDDQLTATAFHRNTMTNSEGGTNDEEFRNAAVVDRVNTTMQVWMGVTMGCAQCHTHKYDPVTQREYFEFFAILDNTEDADRGNEEPNLYVLTDADRAERRRLENEIARLETALAAKAEPAESGPGVLPSGELRTRFVRVQQPGKSVFLHLAEVQVFVDGENVATAGEATQSSTAFDGPARFGNDGNTSGVFTDKSTFHTDGENDPWWEVDLGEPVSVERIVLWNRTDGNVGDRLKNFRVIALDGDRRPVWVRNVGPTPAPSVAFDVPANAGGLTKEDRAAITAYAAAAADGSSPEAERLAEARKQLAAIKGTPTPILRELPAGKRRTTKMQIRGNFMVTGDVVRPGVPAAFNPLPEGVDEPSRLDMARWLVDPANPLTARVAVNRLWEQLFGIGLVETSEDFGLQGEPPSHPELLDWLATEYVRRGWDSKRLLRLIVRSETYRQSSRTTPALVARDPSNRLLARGPSFRLSAETIRDQALAAGGLLSRAMHGESVRPPRPNLGLKAAFGGSTDWDTSPGADRYRRGLYTSWRRTTPYPSFMTFDATSREICTIRRIRTNTPLQALVTLNDPVFVEAAQALGRRVLVETGETLAERLERAVELTLVRPPTADELARLTALYESVHAELAATPEDATALATDPIGPLPEGTNAVDLATWTVVANVLMNLDEFLARR